MIRHTLLNSSHRLLQARMVEFCGWDMPLHYGSQLEEHHAVRRDCGMFDISHMCAIDVAGSEAGAFLLHLLANNVDKLQHPGKALYSCMLNEAGGVLDDLIVYYLGEAGYRVVVNACSADHDLDWMNAQAAGWLKVTLTPRRDLALLAIQGPYAREKFWGVVPATRASTADLGYFHAVEVDDLFVSRTGYTGEDGFEIGLPATRVNALWQALLDAGVRPCGLGARDTLRLEAGMNLYGLDMDSGVSPLDAGLAWTVDLEPGRDFVGRDALLDRPRQGQLLGLILRQSGVLRAQQKVITSHGAGIITSGSFSPTLSQAIALARLPLEAAPGDMAQVEIRGKHCSATVVKPPFVRNGKRMVQ